MLSGVAREKCLIYLDDVLVVGQTFAEHMNNLKEVFAQLLKAGLKLKPSKCKLVQEKVSFLGYVVSGGGISADPQKVQAVLKFPKLTDLESTSCFPGTYILLPAFCFKIFISSTTTVCPDQEGRTI